MAYRLTTQDVDALSDYDAVPNDIEGFTTSELVAELCKREGVVDVEIPEERKWSITCTDDCGCADIWEKGYGAARILVVRE